MKTRVVHLRAESSAAAVLGALLLFTQPGWAGVILIPEAASVSTSTKIERHVGGVFCSCDNFAKINEGVFVDSKPVDCGHCDFTDPNNGATESVGPTHGEVAVNGDAQTITISGTGSGSLSRSVDLSDSIIANSLITGEIDFQVTSLPESVGISVAFDLSGVLSNATATLRDQNGIIIGTINQDESGRHGSFPSGPFDPGTYSVRFSVLGSVESISPDSTSFTCAAQLTVTGGTSTDFHWINQGGGNFGDANNWNLAAVPGAADRAIFDANSGNQIPVTANNEGVGKLEIDQIQVHLQGALRVLGFGTDNLLVLGGLVLDSGVAFSTPDAGIVGGSVSVSGTGTEWTISPFKLEIGPFGSATATVLVDSNAVLNAQNRIELGGTDNSSGNTLRVESGGQVETPRCLVRLGSVQVRGQGTNPSKLQIGEDLRIGSDRGPGNLVIEQGGAVQAQQLFVGDTAGNGGETATISGSASRLDLIGSSSYLQVAGGPGSLLEIKDDGVLTTDLGGEALIGHIFDVGKVFVHGQAGGSPSSWLMLGNLFIGSQIVPSELEVTDGALVTVAHFGDSQMVVGPGTGDRGDVIVSGSGSTLNTESLFVGNFGQGNLTIEDGAFVESFTAVVGGQNSLGGVGLATIKGTPLSSSEWHVIGSCFVGSDQDEHGTIVLRGLPLIGGATLRVDIALEVLRTGAIYGNGKLVAPHVINHGYVQPGLSPGLIVIEGAYEQGTDGTLQMEAGGLNPGDFDMLQINGDATLDGTLVVLFVNGYLPKTGDVLPFLQITGNVSGDFAQITFPQLAPGFEVQPEFVNGTYQLTALTDAVALPCTPPPAGMVGWWPGDDNASDLVNGNNGTLQGGATFAPGEVGQGFSFDGVDDYAEISNTTSLNPSAITLDAWIKPNSVKFASRIVSKDMSADSCSDPEVAYSLEVGGELGSKVAFFFTTSDNVEHMLSGTSVIPIGTFTHVAATFDGEVANIYVNGVLESSMNVTGALASSATPVIIGNAGATCRDSLAKQVEFDGVIDEVEIFSRALSQGEIVAIYNANSSGKCKPEPSPTPTPTPTPTSTPTTPTSTPTPTPTPTSTPNANGSPTSTPEATQSGSATPSAPTPTPRPADVNLDGKVDGDDLDLLITRIFTAAGPGEPDVNRDGRVSAADIPAWFSRAQE